MSTSSLSPSTPQHVDRVTPPAAGSLPTKVRASFARLRERFGAVRLTARIPVLQAEHLFACAMWSETDPEVEE